MKYSIIAFLLILTACTSSKKTSSKSKCADLIVEEIIQPEWENKATHIQIKIKNIGKTNSEATIAKIYDLDIGVKEAKKLGLKGIYIDLIKENVARAKYNEGDEDVSEFDYDKNWEGYFDIPSLRSKQSITLDFWIKDHWIYDSNCEIEVIIDPENKIEECKKENNKKQFFGWG